MRIFAPGRVGPSAGEAFGPELVSNYKRLVKLNGDCADNVQNGVVA